MLPRNCHMLHNPKPDPKPCVSESKRQYAISSMISSEQAWHLVVERTLGIEGRFALYVQGRCKGRHDDPQVAFGLKLAATKVGLEQAEVRDEG